MNCTDRSFQLTWVILRGMIDGLHGSIVFSFVQNLRKQAISQFTQANERSSYSPIQSALDIVCTLKFSSCNCAVKSPFLFHFNSYATKPLPPLQFISEFCILFISGSTPRVFTFFLTTNFNLLGQNDLYCNFL